MTIRSLLTLTDLDVDQLASLVDRSVQFAQQPSRAMDALSDRVVGIYFRKPSTRTRVSFTVGALRLGAKTVAFGTQDLQLSTGETLEDTARVLSGYIDALVIRSNGPLDEMRSLADQDEMGVINAMSECEHPTQAIADLSTLKEKFGRLHDIHVLYVGEGNNTAAALAHAVARTPGMEITFATPEKYALPEQVIRDAGDLAKKNGAQIHNQFGTDNLPKNVDAVYATRWQTLGEPHQESNWKDEFGPYKVTKELMARVSKPETIFMHDLPAVRGEDVDDAVLDGAQSLAWRQARHKMFGAMSALEWCVAGISAQSRAA